MPDWSDIKLKLPPYLGDVPEDSMFYALDIDKEFEKIKEKYGLIDDDFVLDTRGLPGNSKSYTEKARVLPDLKYLLHHINHILGDTKHPISASINSTLHKSKPCPLHCVANQN